jgi:hypothetical protein
VTLRADQRGRRAIAATVAVMVGAGTAEAQSTDDWHYRPPPTSLPQQLNGVLRPSDREEARAARIDNVRQVFAAIRTCWRRAPRRIAYSGQELTIRMSFNNRGEVIGRPQITYYQPGADPHARDVFVNSIMAAFQMCTPLPFSEGLGAAVAGRPFTFRFLDSRPTRVSERILP